MERHDRETTASALLDAMPLACLLIDDRLEVADCNTAAVRLFEFVGREALLERYADIFPPVQPDGADSLVKLRDMYRRAFDGEALTFDWSFRLASGEPVPAEVTMTRVDWHGRYRVAAYCRDLRALRGAEHEVLKQSELLQAVNNVATSLISVQPEGFDRAIWEALRTLGRAADADRTYIWENFEENGRFYSRQIYEWSEGAEPQQGKAFTEALDYDDIPLWKEAVFNNDILNGPIADLPGFEREVLEQQGILSFMVIPVYHEGKPWGYIGFDDCRHIRTFTRTEEQVLLSGGILMISAILRNEMTQRLLATTADLMEHDRLLRAVNRVATMLVGDSADSPAEVLRDAMRILGESVGADRTYIWRNETVGGRLCCRQLMEWFRDRPSDHTAAPAPCVPYDDILPGWETFITSSFVINTTYDELSDELAGFPGMQDVKAIAVIPVFNQGEFWGFIGFDNCRDVAPLKSTQVDLLKSGGMLIASTIIRQEITEHLIEAREDALRSAKAKSEFLSRMSHEIRTPMNAVIGMTTLAKKSDDLERVQYYLGKVDSSSRQLLGIINDVLDMSKIDADKLEITSGEFNFEKMTGSIFNVIQVKVEEKRQEFQFDFPHVFSRRMVTDELRLTQVITNLLSNAVKFTPDGGSITLRVRETPLDDDRSRLRIDVVDTGIGIESERIPRLFDSFEQADGGIARKFGGTGLGLAICKKIVELMGGRIWAESEPGKGSRFSFEVDVGWGAPCGKERPESKLRDDLRILVVDDMPDVLDYFQNLLGSFHLACDTAPGGRQAVELVRRALEEGRPYDIIFIDWYMPEMNGGQTARAIHQIMDGNILVVMISVTDWHEIRPDAEAAGIEHFLHKPVLPSALFNKLVELTHKTFVSREHAVAADSRDWSGKRILIAEDIDINREIVIGILEETGIAIDCAADGREAVDMFSRSPEAYDLILMDVQMPMLDGLSATREIRALPLPRAAGVPIIAMTANAFKEDEKDCLDAGMNAHLSKPIEVADLFAMLGRYLNG